MPHELDALRMERVRANGEPGSWDERSASRIGVNGAGNSRALERIRSERELVSIAWGSGEPHSGSSAASSTPRGLLLKRGLDVLLSVLGLVVSSPLIAVAALLIRVTSTGPAIYRQRRIGKAGREFVMLKLRTMVAGAEEQQEHLQEQNIYGDRKLFKVQGDPRVTRIGKVLRTWSVDELPQLWNVLRGEMSLVGPRPPLPSEVLNYEERHFFRLEVTPGITGPWQVCGRNNVRDFEQVLEIERAYVRSWSLWRDVVILLKTIPVVLLREGVH